MRAGIASASSRGKKRTWIGTLGRDLLVHGCLDARDQLAGERFELEVEPALAGLHVPAGDERPMVAPHDAAERVQRGVGAHQQVATLPVDLGGDAVAGRGSGPSAATRWTMSRSLAPGAFDGEPRAVAAGQPAACRTAGRRPPGRRP